MKFHKSNSVSTYIILSILVLVCLTISILALKVRYLQAKQTLEIFGQRPQVTIPSVTSSDYMLGNPHAKVILIEYSDFECPDCQYFHSTLAKVLHLYKDNIALVSRRDPLAQNKNAEKEAEAALCVGKLGGNAAFWKFSDEIFNKITPVPGGVGLSLSLLPNFAVNAGVKGYDFQRCLSSGQMQQKVLSEQKDAIKGGVHQLPAIFIENKKGVVTLLSGNQPLSVMQTVINALLTL